MITPFGAVGASVSRRMPAGIKVNDLLGERGIKRRINQGPTPSVFAVLFLMILGFLIWVLATV
jgi:hypothetical protein